MTYADIAYRSIEELQANTICEYILMKQRVLILHCLMLLIAVRINGYYFSVSYVSIISY